MYFYYTNNITDKQSENTKKIISGKDPLAKVELVDNFGGHPLFAINRDKVNAMSSAKSSHIAMAMPFASIECVNTVDKNSNINVTLGFLQKQADFNDIANSNKRFAERPIMSLKDLSIRQLNPGGGTTLHHEVMINLRIHSIDEFDSKGLSILLFPGSVLRLTYGWGGVDDKEAPKFLSEKRRMLLAIRSYRLNFTAEMQIDLSLECSSYSNELANIYVGDLGATEKVIEHKGNLIGIAKSYEHLKAINSHLSTISTRNEDKKAEEKIVKSLRTSLANVSAEYAKFFAKNLKEMFEKIEPQDNDKVKSKQKAKIVSKYLHTESTRYMKKDGSKNVPVQKRYIFLGDLIDVFLGETFRSLSGKMYPNSYKTRFLFGCVNNEASIFSGLPLHRFPVDWNLFKSEYGDQIKNSEVFTISAFFGIIKAIISDEEYYKAFLDEDSIKNGFKTPDVYLGVHNYSTKTLGVEENVVEMFLVDLLANVPKIGNKSDQDLESQNPSLPVIKFGHLGSFIKSLTTENVSDEAIRAHLINQAAIRNTLSPVDEVLKQELDGNSSYTGPIYLPLQGEMEVLGSPEWGFGKAFILRVGLKAIDGLYQILETEHQINSAGFTTKLRIRCQGQ